MHDLLSIKRDTPLDKVDTNDLVKNIIVNYDSKPG